MLTNIIIGFGLWFGFCVWMGCFLAAGNCRPDGEED